MAYQKHNWYTGEVVQAINLNHLEQGVYDASKSTEAATNEDIDRLFTGATPSAATATKIIQLGGLSRYYNDEMLVINDKTAVMQGATASAAGKKGVVPTPGVGDNTKFLRGDGAWAEVASEDMQGATSSANGKHGLVPQPLIADREKYLRGDGTWAAVVMNDMVGATASTAGQHGFVPAPSAGDQNKVLYGDGTWKPAIDKTICYFGGSCTFANLPALSAANDGKVMSVTDDFTTTSDFVDGVGKHCEAGTNVAIVNVGTLASPVYKYDASAVSTEVDLSNYYTKSDVDGITGDKANLTTSAKTNLVAAINEVDGDVGNKASLNTSAKTNLVAAVNEVLGDVGDKTTLTTANKNSLVAAVNEHDTEMGDLSNLATQHKANLVEAINEAMAGGGMTIDSTLDTTSSNPVKNSAIATAVNAKQASTLSSPVTIDGTQQTTVEGAIGGLNTAVGNRAKTTDVGDKANLTTTAKNTLVAAINEVDGDVGDKSTLTTTAKTSLVAAVNEVDGDVGDKSTLTTTAKTSLVAAVNEVDGKLGRVLTGTLMAADWVSNEQTVTLAGLKATDVGSVGLLNTATDAQVADAAAAVIRPTTQAADALTFKCTNVPTIDIPFGVFIEG